MATKSRIISIFSSKGGVGKSFIATNLASSLSYHFHIKVALIDLDLIAILDMTKMLGMSIQKSLADILSSSEQAEPQGTDIANLFTLRHDIHFLPAITSHRDMDKITPEILSPFLSKLRQSFEYIIIDTGSEMTNLAISIFENSNLILLISGPDILSIHHTNKDFAILDSLNFPTRMVRAVLNRAESHGSFRSQEVKNSLSCNIITEIPSDGKTVGWSINQGLPLTISSPKSRITLAFKSFAKDLVEHPGIFVDQLQLKIEQSQLVDVIQTVKIVEERDLREDITEQAEVQPRPEDGIAMLKRRVHEKLVDEMDLKHIELSTMTDPVKMKDIRKRTEKLILNLIAQEGGFITEQEERQGLVKEIADDALGLGPLEDLIADSEVSDILVNNKDQVYIEKHGKLYLTEKKFLSNEQILTVIERIIAPLGRRIDESNPMVDARLPDGSRVNAIIPPLSIKGPMLSIRKFSRERYTVEDLVKFGTLTPVMAEFLRACVLVRKNIIVSGGTGSGKTTMLNVLSLFIPDNERIITIEDAAELRLNQAHWASLEARPPNIEGKGAITIRHLFRNTLRMRPDRIIIGECRGDETLDMLQAMNTGHDGSLTTLHANSPQDVISRLDSLVLMSNVDLPVRAIREQIASAIQLIIHTARLSDGSRKITHISEITGMDRNADIIFGNIFVFEQTGVNSDGKVLGEFKTASHIPTFLEEMRVKGISLPEGMFKTP